MEVKGLGEVFVPEDTIEAARQALVDSEPDLYHPRVVVRGAMEDGTLTLRVFTNSYDYRTRAITFLEGWATRQGIGEMLDVLPGVPVCTVCNDTHAMLLTKNNDPATEREVMCTSCPVPCGTCRQHLGAFCKTTPCDCACHTRRPGYREMVPLVMVPRPPPRPCVIGGVSTPVLLTSLAHAVEVLGPDAHALTRSFAHGHLVRGVWALPHPDEHPEAYGLPR